MQQAYIFDAVRTPRGKGKDSGGLYTTRPMDLLASALRSLRDRNNLDTKAVDDVVIGCVTQAKEQGTCIARFAALAAGYAQEAAGVTLNRFCGSGLEAVNQAAAMVASGYHDVIVAGGVESMSRVPMGSDGGAIVDPAVQWSIGSVPQGISGDLLATLYGVDRTQADAFAVQSQKRAAAAIERKAYRSMVPVKDANGVTVLDHDEHPRPTTTVESLGKLKASFQAMGVQYGFDALTRNAYPEVEKIDHIHTAGNSSGIVDGAAAVLVARKETGVAMGLKPRAKIRTLAVSGSEPVLMLSGPMPATEKALKRAGMSIRDIDLFEVNEAFAAVPLAFMKALEVNPEKVNVNGGAIALGHPLGATGAMLLGTALDALEERDENVGLVTMCIGGGMGIATIVERV